MRFCKLSHSHAAGSFLDNRYMYYNCEIKYIYIVN
jgi:hypothetical protein